MGEPAPTERPVALVPGATPPGRAAPPWRSVQGRMVWAFDGLWVLGAVLVYGVSSLAAAGVMHGAGLLLGWPWAAVAAPLAYLAFLVSLILVLGLLRLPLPSQKEGTSKVFGDRAFFVFLMHWMLESYLPPPLMTHVQLLTTLRLLWYRTQGAQLTWSTHISPGARIWSPALCRFGDHTYIGEFAHLSAHLSRGDKLLLAPIVIGDGVNVGAHAHIGPGVTIGKAARIGALVDMAPGCTIDDGADIGPASQLGMGVSVGRNARVEPRTFLDSWTRVPEGEVWAGDPGRKVGMVRPKRDRKRSAR